MKKIALVLALACLPMTSHAGQYGEALNRCFASSTTGKDRTDLARWLFAALAQHPEMADLISMPQNKRDTIYKTTGTVINRLMTEACARELHDAVQYEGPSTVRSAFEFLGRLATQELMANPNVTGDFSMIEKYVDSQKINAVIGPTSAFSEPKK
jgi:hypothetical protein